MKYNDLLKKRSEANTKLAQLYVRAAGRKFTDEEAIEEETLRREVAQYDRELSGLKLTADIAAAQREAHKANANAAFRQLCREVASGKEKRTITLMPTEVGATNNIDASGAISLTIHDLIPTLHEGLDLPQGLRVVTGVVGNEVWPVSVNDVAIEEKGEIETLSRQNLDFANIVPSPRRCGLAVRVSNTAIENAAFDLLGFVQEKFRLALREYLAKKIYSQAQWNGNKGPFAGLTPQNIVLGANAYKNILAEVAKFSDKGFYEGFVCISMDRVTEAELKATPKVAGAAAGFVIENGLCCGYPYTVSHFVDTDLNSADELVPTADRYLEIGYWEWFALQQHGEVKMTVDSTSEGVALDNSVAVVLNTEFSMTDLSTRINGGGEPVGGKYPTQAFGLYKIVEEEPTTV